MPARPPPSRWRRWFAGSGAALGVAGLAGVVLFAAWLRSDDFQQRAVRLIERQVEAATGEQLTLGHVDVEWWPPAVIIEGVNLWDHDSGETIASAPRVRAPLVLRDGRPALGALAVHSPVLQLHLDERGRLQSFDAIPPDPRREPLTELPWSSLRVVDGTFRLKHPRGQLEVAHLDVRPAPRGLSDVNARVDVVIDEMVQSTEIAWPGLRLGPDTIEIPMVHADFPAMTLSGRLTVPLRGDLDGRLRGDLRLDELDDLLVAPTHALGEVTFDVAVDGPAKEPSIDVSILAEDVGIDRPGKRTPILHHRFGDIAAALHVDRDGVEIERAIATWGDGRATLWGRVSVDGTVEEGHLLTEDVSLAYALDLFDAFDGAWADVTLDIESAFSGTIQPLDLRGDADVALGGLVVRDRSVFKPGGATYLSVAHGTATGRWSVDRDALVLEADHIATVRSRGTARASISLTGGPIDIDADLPRGDLSELRPLGDAGLVGVGHLRAHVHGERSGWNAAGRADIDGFEVTGLPYADHLGCDVTSADLKQLEFSDCRGQKGVSPFDGRMSLDFRGPLAMDLDLHLPPDARVEDVTGIFLELEGLRGNMGGTLHLDGPLNDLTGEAHLITSEVDLWGERYPIGGGDAYMDAGVFTLDELWVRRGDEGWALRGGIDRAWALNMELIGQGDIARLDHVGDLAAPIAGTWHAAARIDQTLFDPALHGQIALHDVRYAGRPVPDSLVRFHTAAGITAFSGQALGDLVDLSGTLGLWDEQPYVVDARFTDFPAHLLYPVAADGGRVDALLSGTLRGEGHFGDVPSPLDLTADATDVRLRWGGHDLGNDGPWRWTQRGRRYELERFSLSGGTTHLTLSATGGDAPLDLVGQGTVDADLLRMVVPGLERADGLMSVKLTATGRAPAVDARVEARLDGTLARHESFPGTFEDIVVDVTGGRHGYQVDGHAALAGGEIVVNGQVTADQWRPTRFALDAVADDAQVQWVDWLPPAIGDATLRFDGPLDALLLSGDVRVDEMVFVDRIDWEDWVVEWRNELLVDEAPVEGAGWFDFDIGVRADRTIRLRNNVAEGLASADLRVIGDTSRPGLVGVVDVADTTAYLQDREFNLDRGEIAFRDPWTWDPQLDFDLVTDIASRERRYRVNYRVTGPFSDWRTESRSEPALPQADVNALLWFGMTAEELEEMGELPQAIGQGVADMILADFVLSSQAAQDLRGEIALFDRVDLVTGVNARGDYSPDPRLLVQKRLDAFGGIDVTAEIDLARASDQYYRMDAPLSNGWSLSAWYATRQRDRNLAIGGAYGVDLRARWDVE